MDIMQIFNINSTMLLMMLLIFIVIGPFCYCFLSCAYFPILLFASLFKPEIREKESFIREKDIFLFCETYLLFIFLIPYYTYILEFPYNNIFPVFSIVFLFIIYLIIRIKTDFFTRRRVLNCFCLICFIITFISTAMAAKAYIQLFSFTKLDYKDEMVIPDNVKKIENGVFAFCPTKKLIIPGNVKEIGDGAFFMCKDMKELDIKDGVETIGSWAFTGNDIKKITIPKSVKEISNYAFAYSSLEKIYLPKGVELGEYAFDSFNYDLKIEYY